jgi:hypothetical protein
VSVWLPLLLTAIALVALAANLIVLRRAKAALAQAAALLEEARRAETSLQAKQSLLRFTLKTVSAINADTRRIIMRGGQDG